MTIVRRVVPLLLVAAALLTPDRVSEAQAGRGRWSLFRQATPSAEWRPSPVPATDESSARRFADIICTSGARDHAIKIVSPAGVESIVVCPAVFSQARPLPTEDARTWTVSTQQAAGGAWVVQERAGGATTEQSARNRSLQFCKQRAGIPPVHAVRMTSPDGVERVLTCSEEQRGFSGPPPPVDDEVIRTFGARCRNEMMGIFVDCDCVDRKLGALTAGERVNPSVATTAAANGCPNAQDVLEQRYTAYCIEKRSFQQNNEAVCKCTAAGFAREYVRAPDISSSWIERLRAPIIRRCLREARA